MNHWSDSFGNMLSAQEMIDEAGTANLRELTDWLKKKHEELYPNTIPQDPDEFDKFIDWADQILRESLKDEDR